MDDEPDAPGDFGKIEVPSDGSTEGTAAYLAGALWLSELDTAVQEDVDEEIPEDVGLTLDFTAAEVLELYQILMVTYEAIREGTIPSENPNTERKVLRDVIQHITEEHPVKAVLDNYHVHDSPGTDRVVLHADEKCAMDISTLMGSASTTTDIDIDYDERGVM